MTNENTKFLWCARRASGEVQLVMADSEKEAVEVAEFEWPEWAEYDSLAAVWVATPDDVCTNDEAKAFHY